MFHLKASWEGGAKGEAVGSRVVEGLCSGVEEPRSRERTRVLQMVQGASVSNQSSYSKADGKGRREI